MVINVHHVTEQSASSQSYQLTERVHQCRCAWQGSSTCEVAAASQRLLLSKHTCSAVCRARSVTWDDEIRRSHVHQ